MKVYSTKVVGATALLASAALVLSGCSSSSDSDASGGEDTGSVDQLRIATLLPQTGALEHLIAGPQAAVLLAVEDINEAGGVLGNPVEIVAEGNEGDSNDATVIAKSVDEIIAADPAFVLGAMGSGNTNAAMPKLTEAGILMGSPSNTGIDLSGVNPLYFRTIVSDNAQGNALGNLIVNDGKASVGILAMSNPYGLGLRDNLEATLVEKGVEITYGATGSGNEFPEGQSAFSSEVSGVIATNPEAIAILSYDEAKQIVPELAAQGYDLSNVYMSDGATFPYEGLDEGTLEGAQGTVPGRPIDDAFLSDLIAVYPDVETGSKSYAPESYDAVVLVALAAEKGGAADTQTIVDNLIAVSGANGGTECTSYADCVELIQSGEEIHYVGRAEIILDENHEPSSGLVTLFKFDESNTPVEVSEVES